MYSLNSNKGVVKPENIKKVFIQSYKKEQEEIEKTKKKGIRALIIGLVSFPVGFSLFNAFLVIIGGLGVGLFVLTLMLNTKSKKKVNDVFSNGDIEAPYKFVESKVFEKREPKVYTTSWGT